jgi:hypothetical protein
MTLRRLAATLPVIAVLALAGPVAGANATTTPTPSPAPSVPCFPFPAFCNANGDPVGTLPSPYSFLIPFFHQLYFGPVKFPSLPPATPASS